MEFINIEEMRTKVLKAEWPLPYNNWPENSRDCSMSFALGLPINNRQFFENILSQCRCADDYIEFLENLMTRLELNPRRIRHWSKKTSTEYVIILYTHPYGACGEFTKYYLARMELDNTIALKPNWWALPQKAPLASLETLGTPIAYFAISKP